MTSRLLPLLLSFFLLCGQQGAVIHELSHWHDNVPDVGQRAPQGKPDPLHVPGHPCAVCAAFAAMGAALPSVAMVLPPMRVEAPRIPATPVVFSARVLLAYDSRGPPLSSV